MEFGDSIIDLTTVLVSGAPGSGKTHLRHYIYGQLPPKVRISTACIESACRGTIEESGSLGKVIMVKGVEDMKPWIASAVRDMVSWEGDIEFEDVQATDDNNPVEEMSAKSDSGELQEMVSLQTLSDDSSASQVSTKVDAASQPNQTPISTHDKPQSPSSQSYQKSVDVDKVDVPRNLPPAIKSAILDWLKEHKAHLQLNCHWIHFVDSGGQPSFLEIIPCLIRNIGLLVLVFKLSEELSAHTEVEYWDPDGGHYLGKFSISNEELLTYTAQLSHYHMSQLNLPFVDNPTSPHPKIVVVGTFRDQEYKSKHSRQEKSNRLEEALAPFQDHLIRPHQSNDNGGKPGIIFAVNASLAGQGDGEEEKVANELRQVIKSFAPKYKIKMPLQYLFLEDELRKRAVVSKSYAWEVAQELHFKSMEDLEYCLSYLHQVNLIFYYPESLPDTVITQPDAFVSVITQIFQHHLCLSKREVVSGTDKVFLNQAIFSIELLEQLKIDNNTAVFPHKDMMTLLQHRLIVAPVSTDHYFMPSLLREIPPTTLRNIFKAKSHLSSPLTISFPGLWAPNGVHSALTNKMLNFEGKAQFELVASKQSNVHELVKNVVHMRVKIEGDVGSITLVNLMEYFEIYVSNLSDKHLPLIEDILDKNLRAVYATLSYNVSHKFGILCKCGHKPRHAAFLSHDNHALTCSMTSKTYSEKGKVQKASDLISKTLYSNMYNNCSLIHAVLERVSIFFCLYFVCPFVLLLCLLSCPSVSLKFICNE